LLSLILIEDVQKGSVDVEKKEIKNTYSSKKKYIPENTNVCDFNRGYTKLKKCQLWDVEKEETTRMHQENTSR
jgi:hypothetical protein